MKRKLKRLTSTILAVTMCVALNINPIVTLGTAFIESGIIDTTSTIGKNIVRMSNDMIKEVRAEEGDTDDLPIETPWDDPPTVDNIVVNCSCEHKDYTSILDKIHSETERTRKDVAVIKGYTKELVELSESIDKTTKAILEDTHYIIQQLGYDPSATGVKPKNVRESFERVSDQLDQMSHEYRVANIKSINNMFAGALWKPKFEEVPNLTEYCEITGGFANTYAGYWNTSFNQTEESVLPTEKALEELGYDAILRAEGVIPIAAVQELGGQGDKAEVSLAMPYANINAGSGMNTSNEILVYDSEGNLDVVYNDWGQITDSYNVSEFIPTSQMLEYYQITMPSSNITYLDAVTVLYKALGEDIVTLEGFFTRNPEIEVESSPLAKQLSGVVDTWEGYDYYVFATRSNPISYEIEGENRIVRYDYAYWKKAVTAGFVNYNLRDEPISAVDFCTLAAKMMEAYGEPAFTDDELHTLLQVYGSSYPIQMGDKIAQSWAYLKARGIITDDNFPEVYTDSLSRNQLLDMCARIKNPDLRDTYKNITLAITLDDVVVDDGVYPYYDLSIDAGSNMFLETSIDYKSLNHYTYLFPMTTNGAESVNLGYGGSGWVFTSTEFTTLVEGASYNGMIKLDDDTGGHYYYVVQIPKDYKGNAYLRFVDYNDQQRDIGTVAAIELNPNHMIGGIFTQYEFGNVPNDPDRKIAKLAKPEENSNWYSFASLPNNMDLIWYGDVIRCNDKVENLQTAALVTPCNPTLGERLNVFWNNLTEPMSVMAAPGQTSDFSIPQKSHKWSFSFDNAPYDGTVGTIADDDTKISDKIIKQNSITTSDYGTVNYYSDSDKTIERAVDSKALTYIARAAMMTDMNFGIFYNEVSKALADANQQISGGGANVRNVNPLDILLLSSYNTGSIGNITYQKLKENIGANGFSSEDFPALFYVAANGAANQPVGPLSDSMHTKSVIDSLKTDITSPVVSLFAPEIDANGVSNPTSFKAEPITADGVVKATGSASDIDAYGNTISRYLNDDIFRSSGSSGLKKLSLDNTLESSVLMDRHNQIFISWTEMVNYGLAYDIDADGIPKLSETDGVYEFVTHHGVVRVDDVNKIIQIGSMLYSFPYEENPPALVHSSADGKNVYFDIRCITGISNDQGYTLDAGVATIQQRVMGTGDYAILTITPFEKVNSGSMTLNSVPVIPYADMMDPAVAEPSTQRMSVITSTIYDGMEAVTSDPNGSSQDNFFYWVTNEVDADGNKKEVKDSTRVTMSSTVPTANWIFVTSDTGKEFGGRLYVFYLAKAYDEGFLSKDGSSIETVEPTQTFKDLWKNQYPAALARIATNYPSLQFEQEFDKIYKDVANQDSWQLSMTKHALANLAADTGVLWSSSNYYVRCFDYTNASCANNAVNHDMTKSFTEFDEAVAKDRSNKPGALYFLDYIGYVYNVPYIRASTNKGVTDSELFTLEKYYSGEYPLPLGMSLSSSIVNCNFNYYGKVNSEYGTESLPLGIDLTSQGFIHFSTTNVWKDSIYKGLDKSKFGADKASDVHRVPPPFECGYDEDSNYATTTFKAAPVGVYMRYGLFRDTDFDKRLNDISSSNTNINEYYLGTRRIQMSDTVSQDSKMRYWTYVAKDYGPIGLSVNLMAELCHKYMKASQTSTMTSAYVINSNNILTPYITQMGDVRTLGMGTPEIDWDGRAKLVSILDAIDKGTNWWIWVCLTLAPMICVILMTILIGMSFMTESKIWLAFCDKFFDPVRICTFGVTDSHHWNWRKVLIPCLITYIAFALLCNANILKIIIYVVDAWMRLMQAI